MLCSVPPPPPLVCRRATATHATRRGRSGGFSFTALGGPPAPLPTAGPAGGRRTVQHNNIPCRATPHHPSPRRCAQTGGRPPVCVYVRVCVTPPPPVGGGANNPSRACSFRRPRVFCLRGLPARASVVWWVLARARPRCGRRPCRSHAPRHRGCCSLSDDAAAQGARPAGAGRWALQRAAHASPPHLAGGGWAGQPRGCGCDPPQPCAAPPPRPHAPSPVSAAAAIERRASVGPAVTPQCVAGTATARVGCAAWRERGVWRVCREGSQIGGDGCGRAGAAAVASRLRSGGRVTDGQARACRRGSCVSTSAVRYTPLASGRRQGPRVNPRLRPPRAGDRFNSFGWWEVGRKAERERGRERAAAARAHPG